MTVRLPSSSRRAAVRELTLCPAAGVWAVAVLVLAVGLTWAVVAGVRLRLGEFASLAGAFFMLVAVGSVYAMSRRAVAIVVSCFAVAFLILFNIAAGILSYAGQWLAAPLQDDWFASFDAALGFDWNAHLAFVAHRPVLAQTLTWAYFSCPAQLFVLVCVLSVFDRSALVRFMALYATTALATICIASAFPALGAVAHHAPPAALLSSMPDPLSGRWHMADLIALRQGAFREISPHALEGIISFPSFHTALGVLFIHAFARAPRMLAPAILLNGAMILSTISVGGHYFADVIAGAVLAGVSIVAFQAWQTRALRLPRPESAPAPALRDALDPSAPRG